MKASVKILVILIVALFSTVSFARDTIASYSIKNALSPSLVKKAKLDKKVSFYFGKQKHGKVLKNFGEVRTNRKTNAFGKSDETACQWGFLSALKVLRKAALKKGGNAVINIKSNYKHHLTSSNTGFVCGAGAFAAGVALVGTVVKEIRPVPRKVRKLHK